MDEDKLNTNKKHRSAVLIRCFPALNGDCMLISFGQAKQKHILVDFGYTDTYNKHLAGVLREIADVGERLEKVIITHIDSDHILGAKAFFQDELLAKKITLEVWHNSLRHLAFPNELPQTFCDDEPDFLRRIITRGYIDEKCNVPGPISAKQGTTIGAMLLQGGYAWNTSFGGRAACIENSGKIVIDTTTSVILLSPNRQKLDALRKTWEKELKKFGKHMSSYVPGYDDAFEMWTSWENALASRTQRKIASAMDVESLARLPLPVDNTATNGSSIAFILEVDDKKILMLADAHADVVLNSLNTYSDEMILFDLIKVSHHGSAANISQALLEKIDSPIFLFSTNGDRHAHPDKETIARIVIRKTSIKRRLTFNYKTPNATYFDREDWKKTYNYDVNYLDIEPFKITL